MSDFPPPQKSNHAQIIDIEVQKGKDKLTEIPEEIDVLPLAGCQDPVEV